MAQKNICILRGHITNPSGVVNFYRGLEPLFTWGTNISKLFTERNLNTIFAKWLSKEGGVI